MLLPVGQDCDRIGELVDEAIHQDNMAKVRTVFLKSAVISLGSLSLLAFHKSD
jgi:hypothetical protein